MERSVNVSHGRLQNYFYSLCYDNFETLRHQAELAISLFYIGLRLKEFGGRSRYPVDKLKEDRGQI